MSSSVEAATAGDSTLALHIPPCSMDSHSKVLPRGVNPTSKCAGHPASHSFTQYFV